MKFWDYWYRFIGVDGKGTPVEPGNELWFKNEGEADRFRYLRDFILSEPEECEKLVGDYANPDMSEVNRLIYVNGGFCENRR